MMTSEMQMWIGTVLVGAVVTGEAAEGMSS